VRGDEHVGKDRRRRHRDEVFLEVVRKVLVRGGRNGAVHGVEQHGVAIGWGLRDDGRADRAARAAAVVDHDLLAYPLAELAAQVAPENIVAASRRKRNHPAYGLVGIDGGRGASGFELRRGNCEERCCNCKPQPMGRLHAGLLLVGRRLP
jgi:hypothetical protein